MNVWLRDYAIMSLSIVKNYGHTRSAALRVPLCLKLPIAHDDLPSPATSLPTLCISRRPCAVVSLPASCLHVSSMSSSRHDERHRHVMMSVISSPSCETTFCC
jgi:hypothetical protein